MNTPRIHIQRDGAYGYVRETAHRTWGLFGYDGRLRTVLRGNAGFARREAKRIIDANPKCFPNNPNGGS